MRRINPALLGLAATLLLALTARADSLWKEKRSLFADNKAWTVGDVVTVVVVEEAKLSSSAGTSLSKTTDTAAEISTLQVAGTSVFPANEPPKVKASSSRGFDGEGSYVLSGSMETRLTALVLEVLPNGNLVVEGSRLRQSVDDEVMVRISGIVRPEDITSENTVLSTSLAEGKIVFDTHGPIASSSRRGICGRIIDFVWPF